MDDYAGNHVQYQFLTLEELRQSISLNNSEINELVHHQQKFVNLIKKLNNEAKNKIDIEKPREGLVYLGEAEKILEYGASCGKNIDRNIIVCILHNEACCYQRLWELQKCSNYLEALIFNVSSHLKTSTPSPRQSQQFIKTSTTLASDLPQKLYGKPISHRFQLAKYHLQYCAINSQLRNHKGSLASAKRAITIIKNIFLQLNQFSTAKAPVSSGNNSCGGSLIQQGQNDFENKIQIIKGVSNMIDEHDITRRSDYQISTRYFLKKWNIRKIQSDNEYLRSFFKNFSIGNVMQVRPQDMDYVGMNSHDINHELFGDIFREQKYEGQSLKIYTLPKVINFVLLLTIGYFTAATQLRLIATEKYSNDEQQKKKSHQFIQSEIYHMVAIIISCIYIPYDMIYMRHLLTSFNNHYTSDIISEQQDSPGNVMYDEFDYTGYSLIKRKIQKQTNKSSRHINRSLAIEFAHTIKAASMIEQQIKKKCFSAQKIGKSKDTFAMKNQTKKQKSPLAVTFLHRRNKTNSKEKYRAFSEDGPGKITILLRQSPHKQVVVSKKKEGTKKGKSKSSQKSNSSNKNNRSCKKMKKQKNPQKLLDKQTKQQYYSHKKMKIPKDFKESGANSREKRRRGQVGSFIKKAKVMINSVTTGTNKKGTPLRKTLDKYYF